MRLGVVGCGQISSQYLTNLTQRFGFCVRVVALADLRREAAEARAAEFGVPSVLEVEELLTHPEIDGIVNLTIPDAHHELGLTALRAGKHVYNEKPFCITREEAQELLREAAARGVRLSGAPDTFLGAGLQTCRKLIDDGWLGTPITATAFIGMPLATTGYLEKLKGPIFDMGPYYVTALVSLLGPVVRVSGATRPGPAVRSIIDPESAAFGSTYELDAPVHATAVLEFASGPLATLTICSDLIGYLPRLEVYGTEGTLTCNDPNMFGGPIFLQRRSAERREMPLSHRYTAGNRGLGMAELACAVAAGRPHRIPGELPYHVLDVLHAVHETAREGRAIPIASTVERPAPLPAGLALNELL